MPLTLTARERARLKARAHHLEPIVRVGQAGLSDAFIAEVDRALADHELIKVRIDGGGRDQRRAVADEVCARTQAARVQSVGKVVVIFRPNPEEEEKA